MPAFVKLIRDHDRVPVFVNLDNISIISEISDKNQYMIRFSSGAGAPPGGVIVTKESGEKLVKSISVRDLTSTE